MKTKIYEIINQINKITNLHSKSLKNNFKVIKKIKENFFDKTYDFKKMLYYIMI